MKKAILMLVGGLLLGAVGTAYFLGASRSGKLPGIPLKPPDASGDTSGTVAVTVDEKFSIRCWGRSLPSLAHPNSSSPRPSRTR